MSAQKTMGTTLTKTSGTPAVIAGLDSIGPIGIGRDEIEVTTLDSSNDYREFLAGLKDGGEVAITGVITSESSFTTMFNLAEAGTTETWEVEFTGGAILFMSGFVKEFKHDEIPVNDARRFTGVIRVTGPVEYASTGISA